jgi:hypothetical protein
MITDTKRVSAKLVKEAAFGAGSYIKLGYDIFFHNTVIFTHIIVTHHEEWPLRPTFAISGNLPLRDSHAYTSQRLPFLCITLREIMTYSTHCSANLCANLVFSANLCVLLMPLL